MSKDLVQKQDAALGEYTPQDFGNLPRPPDPLICKLGQGTSQKGEPGKFNFSNPSWESVDKLEGVVVLTPRAGRVLYGEKFDSPSRCSSDNFQNPSARVKVPVSDSCMDCPAAMWPNNLITEDQIKVRDGLIAELKPQRTNIPLCKETVNLIMVDGRMTPFMMQFQSTGLKNVYENLINVLRYSGKRIFAQQFDVTIKRVTKQTDRGPTHYYEPVFGNFRDISEDQKAGMERMAAYWSAMAKQILSEQFEKMDQEKEAVPF